MMLQPCSRARMRARPWPIPLPAPVMSARRGWDSESAILSSETHIFLCELSGPVAAPEVARASLTATGRDSTFWRPLQPYLSLKYDFQRPICDYGRPNSIHSLCGAGLGAQCWGLSSTPACSETGVAVVTVSSGELSVPRRSKRYKDQRKRPQRGVKPWSPRHKHQEGHWVSYTSSPTPSASAP